MEMLYKAFLSAPIANLIEFAESWEGETADFTKAEGAMLDFDGDGTPEFWYIVYAEGASRYFHASGLCTIKNGKVVNLIDIGYNPNAWTGIYIKYNKNTQEHVIFKTHGNRYDFFDDNTAYVLKNGNLTVIEEFSGAGYGGDSYAVNGKEVSEAQYKRELDKYIDPTGNRYKLVWETYDMLSASAAGYILPYSNSRALTDADLRYLSKDSLRLARNEIYARYGRVFADKTVQDYFNGKSWYQKLTKLPQGKEPALSQLELANIDMIKQYEAKY